MTAAGCLELTVGFVERSLARLMPVSDGSQGLARMSFSLSLHREASVQGVAVPPTTAVKGVSKGVGVNCELFWKD